MDKLFKISNYKDILSVIFDYLNDNQKIKLCMASKYLYSYIKLISYNDSYEYNNVKHLPFLNNFKQIKYKYMQYGIPNGVTHLFIEYIIFEDIKYHIPSSIKHFNI